MNLVTYTYRFSLFLKVLQSTSIEFIDDTSGTIWSGQPQFEVNHPDASYPRVHAYRYVSSEFLRRINFALVIWT